MTALYTWNESGKLDLGRRTDNGKVKAHEDTTEKNKGDSYGRGLGEGKVGMRVLSSQRVPSRSLIG